MPPSTHRDLPTRADPREKCAVGDATVTGTGCLPPTKKKKKVGLLTSLHTRLVRAVSCLTLVHCSMPLASPPRASRFGHIGARGREVAPHVQVDEERVCATLSKRAMSDGHQIAERGHSRALRTEMPPASSCCIGLERTERTGSTIDAHMYLPQPALPRGKE